MHLVLIGRNVLYNDLERESCNKDARGELFLVVHNLQMDGPFLGS